MKNEEKLDVIIARRSLKIAGGNRKVMVYLGKPQRINENGQTYFIGNYQNGVNTQVDIPKGDWICPLKITGLPLSDLPKSFYAEAWGKDSLAALLAALRMINALLDKCNPPLQWTYSWGFDPGFPLMIEPFGLENRLELRERFEKTVGRELKKQAKRPRPAWVIKAFKQLSK